MVKSRPWVDPLHNHIIWRQPCGENSNIYVLQTFVYLIYIGYHQYDEVHSGYGWANAYNWPWWRGYHRLERRESAIRSLAGGEDWNRKRVIRVSAKHLTPVSPVFKSFLFGGWKESSTFLETGSTELIVSGWDLEAFLVVMQMIHSQHKKIPRKVNLELFAKITIIADYYKCKDAIGFFSDVWLDDLNSNSDLQNRIACTFSRDLMLWLWISWMFRRAEQFKQSTAVAMKYSKAQITSLGLPLPARLISSGVPLVNKNWRHHID